MGKITRAKEIMNDTPKLTAKKISQQIHLPESEADAFILSEEGKKLAQKTEKIVEKIQKRLEGGSD